MAKRETHSERVARVKRLHMNATKKVSRVRRTSGVELGNTDYDVRVPAQRIASMNMRELSAYEKSLRSFNSRDTGFLKGANNTVIDRKAWGEFKRVEAMVNAAGAKWDAGIKDVFIPEAGMTVAQRQATIKPDRVKAMGEATPRLYVHSDSKPENVNGMKAVQFLTKKMKERLRPGYAKKEIKKGRNAFTQMFVAMGADNLIEELHTLSDHQFAILTKETGFADATGLRYALISMTNVDTKPGYHETVVEDQTGIIHDYLAWAKTLPKSAKSGTPKPRR